MGSHITSQKSKLIPTAGSNFNPKPRRASQTLHSARFPSFSAFCWPAPRFRRASSQRRMEIRGIIMLGVAPKRRFSHACSQARSGTSSFSLFPKPACLPVCPRTSPGRSLCSFVSARCETFVGGVNSAPSTHYFHLNYNQKTNLRQYHKRSIKSPLFTRGR